MVDLEYLNNIKLVEEPFAQKIVGTLLLKPNYEIFRHVDIRFENVERIPRNENVIFAMNHTDRFNYWPFQYKLWRMNYPFTTVWVKGKYYRNSLIATGLDLCRLIPVPSMGYLLEEFYQRKFHKRMDRDVYRKIRDVVDEKNQDPEVSRKALAETAELMGDDFVDFIRDYYERIMAKVAELSLRALREKGLSVIIFPEGTRGSQLGEGKTGIAQVALHTGKTVVPVGCNNSDAVYPGSSPFAKSGWITYRIGEPLTLDNQLKDYRIGETFQLLSRESQKKYRAQFEGATAVIMKGINAQLDEKYRRD
jgi:1-acyl-sn-glycerol-3-phosphate acyltransferase